ncbi:MAG: LAGLIDADG family homing endonuclease [Candidatus Pacebacteria bacterium]|nr:LAGLIDADG family homing endonuclease [Candidatus Paceibacterota bacterium]MDD5356865.1 LAGLIDADG family homing endonuclease [Candidatus Paceibacterota bacterium]
MTLSSLETLCTLCKLARPKNIEIKERYWYAKIGAPIGGKVVHEKYGPLIGNQEYRKSQWKKWWDTKGKFRMNSVLLEKRVHLPKQSPLLAEFMGIMLGDGGITKYQFRISLNGKTDKKYSLYVRNLIKKLFRIRAKKQLRKQSDGIDIVVSRKGINKYLILLGLKSGDKLKQNLDIPEWIMKNKKYQKMCLRGLIDTDGCLFYETHLIKGKKYSYPRLNFVTASPSLATSVFNILIDLNFKARLRKNGRNSAVQLENKAEIWQYFKTIGTSNPKHLNRWHILGRRV